jgi:hypothetical protein
VQSTVRRLTDREAAAGMKHDAYIKFALVEQNIMTVLNHFVTAISDLPSTES